MDQKSQVKSGQDRLIMMEVMALVALAAASVDTNPPFSAPPSPPAFSTCDSSMPPDWLAR
jgi:hypothetical protein